MARPGSLKSMRAMRTNREAWFSGAGGFVAVGECGFVAVVSVGDVDGLVGEGAGDGVGRGPLGMVQQA